jgi:hypothetical protein
LKFSRKWMKKSNISSGVAAMEIVSLSVIISLT